MLNPKFLIFATVVVYSFLFGFALLENICGGTSNISNENQLIGTWHYAGSKYRDPNESLVLWGTIPVQKSDKGLSVGNKNISAAIPHIYYPFQFFIESHPAIAKKFQWQRTNRDFMFLTCNDNEELFIYYNGRNTSCVWSKSGRLSNNFTEALTKRFNGKNTNFLVKNYRKYVLLSELQNFHRKL